MRYNFTKFYILFLLLCVFLSGNPGGAKDLPFETAPLNPAFEEFIKSPKRPSGEYPLGLIPDPIKLKPSKKRLPLQTLPDRYDLREHGLVTPIKDQDGYRTCWAFASYGSLESDLLKLGQPIYDFSENNLVNKDEFDLGFGEGGNIFMTSAYLARGRGPVLESCDPYPHPDASPDCPRVKYIENIVWLAGRQSVNDNEYLKQAVYTHGAVYTSMYWDGAYYDSANHTYYYPGTHSPNHAVVIVGWDDNKQTQATNPGAWIVRNSWGEDFGENGYFYVSYYDTVFAFATNAYFVDRADLNRGNFIIHQYDELGLEYALRCSSSNTIYGANIFRAQRFQKIKAVSFFAGAPADYEIRIYKNYGSPSITQTGNISEAGYYTIDLNTPVYVEKGRYFLVMLKLTTSSSDLYPLGVEAKIDNYSSKATCRYGESFVSCDGRNWDDICGYGGITNVCIKAFAIPKRRVNYVAPIIMLLLGK